MLIVAGALHVEPDRRSEYLTAFKRTTLQPTLAEPGCLDYVLSADPADPAGVRIFERWESTDALARHVSTEHVAKFNETVAGIKQLQHEVYYYEISAVRRLRQGDARRIAANDLNW